MDRDRRSQLPEVVVSERLGPLGEEERRIEQGGSALVRSAPLLTHGVRRTELKEALASAHHVSLHMPLVPETRHVIDRAAIRRMRPGTMVVNTARGGLIDEQALAEELASGHLGGAGLDVTEHERLAPDHPLLPAGAVTTAHSASWSRSSRPELARRSVDASIDVLAGRIPEAVVNREVLHSARLRMHASSI